MDKQKEIEILQSLKGDTYFRQFFNVHDIDQMCENIRNDFAIEMDCQFRTETLELKNKVKELDEQYVKKLNSQIEESKKRLEEFAESIIVAGGSNLDCDVYDKVEEEFGISFIIKTKWKHSIELDESELDYMVKKL